MPLQQDQGGRRRDPPAAGLHRRLAGRGARRGRGRQDADARPQVRPEPRALDRRHPPHLQAGSAGLREVAPACRACSAASASRSSRRRRACSPTGRPARGRRRGSPRLRLVTGGGADTCRASASCPSPSPPASTSPSTASTSRSRAPRARCATPSREPITIERDDDGTLAVTPSRRRAAEPRAARAHPHAGRQHGHRRDRGLREEARDRRRRLPRAAEGPRPSSSRSGFSHPVLSSRPRASRSPSRAPTQVLGRRASTSSRSARSPRTSASCASPSRTRARASATPASRSAARSERLGSSHGSRTQDREASRRQARASRLRRHLRVRKKVSGTRRASAAGRDPLEPAHVRPGRRRRRGPHARLGLHDGGRPARRRRRQDRQGAQGRRARRRAGQGRRRRDASCSTGRQPLPRPGRGAGRRCPRGRADF